MEFLKATTDMEYNGMFVDTIELGAERIKLKIEIEDLYKVLKKFIFKYSYLNLDPSSPKQMSTFLFGGTIKQKVSSLMIDSTTKEYIRYKTGLKRGRIKSKNKEIETKIEGITTPVITRKNNNGYPVDEKQIQALLKRTKNTVFKLFLKSFLHYKELIKDHSTYYVGYSALVWPHDNCIHPNLNHTITHTGRLSCSAPNLQNLTNKS